MVAGPGRPELLTAALSVLLGLVALEGGARVLRSRVRPGGYAPVTARREAQQLNARGYRDEQHAEEKPAGTRRLLALGDSFTWGAGVELDDTWPQRVERGLRRRRQESWEVVSLALPGFTTRDEAAAFEAEGLRFAPDAVVLAYVLNDAETRDGMLARERAEAEREARPASPLEASALFGFVRSRIEATLATRRRIDYHRGLYREDAPGWREVREALHRIGGLCRARGVPLIVAVFPLLGNPLDDTYPFADLHPRIAAASTEAGALAVDLWPVYRGLRWELLVVDGERDEHPNELAHRIAANAILHALAEAIPRPVKGRAGEEPLSPR